jgi:DNA-binding GntR family transcriptional regulator
VATAEFTEIRGEPLSAIVLRTLREAIVEGRLAPGEAVVEAQLSRQLGVSRAPLREALRSLENEGLVVSTPWRGALVAPLTERGVTELQTFRRLIEVFAAEQVLERDDVDLSSLDALVAEMERCAAASDLACMNEADVRFHTRIVEMSGNALLLDVWRSYVSPIRRALALRNRANSDLDSIVTMHRNLIAAFAARDIDAVRVCYLTHGADVVVALRHLFAEDGDGSSPDDAGRDYPRSDVAPPETVTAERRRPAT